MKKLLPLLLILVSITSQAQNFKLASGTVQTFANFPSKNVAPRNLYVWLPEGYTPKKKYAVLYMHDGQMLFDSTSTWNKQEWGVDETLGDLIKKKKVAGCIVVGVPSNGAYRHAEYFPEKALHYLPAGTRENFVKSALKGKPLADRYLQFLVSEVKPFIDSSFSTYTDAAHTYIAGSSMGGLISMYAFCEYPTVFANAACLSTHWVGVFGQNDTYPDALRTYMAEHLPTTGKNKIYFDYGTATLDSLYEPHQLKIDALMQSKGYGPKQWITRKFQGDDHSEQAWRRRFSIPLLFLMKR